MFYLILSKILKKKQVTPQTIFILGSICYILIHAILYSKNNTNKILQDKRKYIYYIFLFDVAVTGSYFYLFKNKSVKTVEITETSKKVPKLNVHLESENSEKKENDNGSAKEKPKNLTKEKKKDIDEIDKDIDKIDKDIDKIEKDINQKSELPQDANVTDKQFTLELPKETKIKEEKEIKEENNENNTKTRNKINDKLKNDILAKKKLLEARNVNDDTNQIEEDTDIPEYQDA